MAGFNADDVEALGKVNNPAQADAMRRRLTAELATATPKRQAEIQRALSVLDEAHPTSPEPPKAEPGTTVVHAPRAHSPSPTKPRAPSPARPSGPRPNRRLSAAPVRAKTSARRPMGRVQRAGRSIVTEASGHAEAIGPLIVTVLGATIAFAVFYALITSAERAPSGKGALDVIGGAFTTGLKAFVLPVDPLNPSGSTDATKPLTSAASKPGTGAKTGAAGVAGTTGSGGPGTSTTAINSAISALKAHPVKGTR